MYVLYCNVKPVYLMVAAPAELNTRNRYVILKEPKLTIATARALLQLHRLSASVQRPRRVSRRRLLSVGQVSDNR